MRNPVIPINQKKRDIDIVEIITGRGVELRRAGSLYKGLCPFHTEKTPSFVVSPAKQTFHCFGCNESGDVIDFIKLHCGIDFKDAIKMLGLADEKMTAQEKKNISVAIQKSQRKKALADVFSRWQSEAISHYCMLVRATCRASEALTDKNFDQYANIFQPTATWEYWIDILIGGNDQEKLALFEHHTKNHIEITQRNKLFKPSFDYQHWLRQVKW